jgi:hypothetical protein
MLGDFSFDDQPETRFSFPKASCRIAAQQMFRIMIPRFLLAWDFLFF